MSAVTLCNSLDHVMQPTYLLLVQLRVGAQVSDVGVLRKQCEAAAEALPGALRAAGLTPLSAARVQLAQCALLDEALLHSMPEADRHAWAGELLQAKFLGHHQAGEALLEAMHAALAEPAPDARVLGVFHRVLLLGFKGRFDREDAPERLQLLAALEAHGGPLDSDLALPVAAPAGLRRARARLGMFGHGLLACALLALAWWLCDAQLGHALAALQPPQALP